MARFSVVIPTAVPTSLGAEGAGALVKVDGRECLLRAVDMFVNREGIGQIHLMIGPDRADEARQKFGGHLSFSGAKMLVAGAQWMEQLSAAAEKIAPDCTHVLLHDAARPAVAYTDLEAIMAEAEKHPIVMMSVPVRGGILEMDETGRPRALTSGRDYQQVVTPWAFRKDKFLEMVAAKREPHASEVWALRSSALNIRVTNPTEASLAKSILTLLPKPKIRAADNPFEEAQW